MAYDEGVAHELREKLRERNDITEKKMFGGMVFLLNGKMVCGVIGEDIVFRIGPDLFKNALKVEHVRPMDFTGRPMKGYIYLAPEGHSDENIDMFLQQSIDFVSILH